MGWERLGRIAGYTLSRREAYLIVLVTFVAVMVAILGRWPAWVIGASVAGGAVLMALLVIDSLSDPLVEQEASLAGIDLGRIGDRGLRTSVAKAVEYVRGVHNLVREDREDVLTSADDELPQMEEAARSIYEMALRVQEFRADRLIQRDLRDLRYERSRSSTMSESRQDQLDSLEKLDGLVADAEREIDAALAHLGQSYAEIKAIEVTPEIKGRSFETLKELKQSTQRLSDLAAGYDEAFNQRAGTGGSERR